MGRTAVSATGSDGGIDADLAHHRPELLAYCYRMLGSPFEAEDAVQETLLRAWRGYRTFEGRSAVPTWLYRIATNVCLDLIGSHSRRVLPMDLGPPSDGAEAPEPMGGTQWIEPFADERVLSRSDPGEVVDMRAGVRLAFVAALQYLQPRPRAVLILRDVLAWRGNDIAELLGTTPEAVYSALQRARRILREANAGGSDVPPLDRAGEDLVSRYVDAFEQYDIDRLVSLLHEDATFTMPPAALWLRGTLPIQRWWEGHGAGCRSSKIIRTAANGGPALAQYRPGRDGALDPFCIQVLELDHGLIVVIHHFVEPALFPTFDLRFAWPRRVRSALWGPSISAADPKSDPNQETRARGPVAIVAQAAPLPCSPSARGQYDLGGVDELCRLDLRVRQLGDGFRTWDRSSMLKATRPTLDGSAMPASGARTDPNVDAEAESRRPRSEGWKGPRCAN